MNITTGMPFRIGHGYDVHKMVDGRALILGGVTVPYHKGLLGYSDADVLTHAVMDALLGAAGLGDIGTHFPDTEIRWKGARSLMLLEQVHKLLLIQGYHVGNVDATIIAQAPKLAAFLLEMRDNLAKAMQIAPQCVNVKATTEEYLGFTGQGEGMAAHGVALLVASGQAPQVQWR